MTYKIGHKRPPPGFKKGQSGNPRGAQLHNPELKAIKKMTQEDVAMLGQLILEGNLQKLIAIKEEKDAPVLKVWFASVAVKAIQKGDMTALDGLLNRIIGKPKEKLEVDATVTKHKYVVILPSNGRD